MNSKVSPLQGKTTQKKKKIMKFEHVLQIYWSKGFLINGKLQSFQVSLRYLFNATGGFNWSTKSLLLKRFELNHPYKIPNTPINEVRPTIPMSLNLMFSRLTTVNNSIFDINRYTLLRLYLIKTTRGRSHALGKPSRGQRTWSNAWTSYNVNKTTRAFIGAYQRVLKEKNSWGENKLQTS
jgi:ribosomal protein S13